MTKKKLEKIHIDRDIWFESKEFLSESISDLAVKKWKIRKCLSPEEAANEALLDTLVYVAAALSVPCPTLAKDLIKVLEKHTDAHINTKEE